jgi:hypothetical protein
MPPCNVDNFFYSFILPPATSTEGCKIKLEKKIGQHCKGIFSQFFLTGGKAKSTYIAGEKDLFILFLIIHYNFQFFFLVLIL